MCDIETQIGPLGTFIDQCIRDSRNKRPPVVISESARVSGVWCENGDNNNNINNNNFVALATMSAGPGRPCPPRGIPERLRTTANDTSTLPIVSYRSYGQTYAAGPGSRPCPRGISEQQRETGNIGPKRF